MNIFIKDDEGNYVQCPWLLYDLVKHGPKNFLRIMGLVIIVPPLIFLLIIGMAFLLNGILELF